MHTAVRPRIVMLWVFFLVTVIVVGPSVPASAFVSCTWHHSQFSGEHPEVINENAKPQTSLSVKAVPERFPNKSNKRFPVTVAVQYATILDGPFGLSPTGIAARAPPAAA